jgi:hypothetical protein
MAKDELERRVGNLRGNKRGRNPGSSSSDDEEDNIPLAGRLQALRESSIRLGGTDERPHYAKRNLDGGLTLYRCYKKRDGGLEASWRDTVELGKNDVDLLRANAQAIGTAYVNKDADYDLPLSNATNVRVNGYKGSWTVNIRKIKDGRPTIPGLNLKGDEWSALVHAVNAPRQGQ